MKYIFLLFNRTWQSIDSVFEESEIFLRKNATSFSETELIRIENVIRRQFGFSFRNFFVRNEFDQLDQWIFLLLLRPKELDGLIDHEIKALAFPPKKVEKNINAIL